MESHVGSVLRKARNRRKIELSEVEAATRIRMRFLQAIESEEWDVLPGGVYTRGFIRTYASSSAWTASAWQRTTDGHRRNGRRSRGGPRACCGRRINRHGLLRWATTVSATRLACRGQQ